MPDWISSNSYSQANAIAYIKSGRNRWIIAHSARPLFHDVVRSVMFTPAYPSVCLWHQPRSLLERATDSEINIERQYFSVWCDYESSILDHSGGQRPVVIFGQRTKKYKVAVVHYTYGLS